MCAPLIVQSLTIPPLSLTSSHNRHHHRVRPWVHEKYFFLEQNEVHFPFFAIDTLHCDLNPLSSARDPNPQIRTQMPIQRLPVPESDDDGLVGYFPESSFSFPSKLFFASIATIRIEFFSIRLSQCDSALCSFRCGYLASAELGTISLPACVDFSVHFQ